MNTINPPTWLDAQSREIWNTVIGDAQASPAWKPSSVLPLGRYCNAFARYLELQRFLADKGVNGATYPVKDAKGNVRTIAELPQSREFRALHHELLRLEEGFGLVPSARARIDATTATAKRRRSAP